MHDSEVETFRCFQIPYAVYTNASRHCLNNKARSSTVKMNDKTPKLTLALEAAETDYLFDSVSVLQKRTG